MGKKQPAEITYNNKQDHQNTRIAIVVAKWNSQVVENLREAAVATLQKYGVIQISVLHVSGSYELPQGANIALQYQHYDAVICLGCVIQGETRHFEFICQSVSSAIQQVSLKYNKPVVFGVLTTDTFEQASERAGGKFGNKGTDAAITALEMIDLTQNISSSKI